MKESCENCYHFVSMKNDKNKGECRKNPPGIDHEGYSYWPVINFEYYNRIDMPCRCSEWERR